MSNSLYKVTPGVLNAPLASDINQIPDALNGAFDIGQITFAPQIAPPSVVGVTASAVAGSGLGIGGYIYKLAYVVGYKKSDNSLIYGNETNGSASVSVTTTSGNQKVNLAGLPNSWPATAIALLIYRTAVGGADNTQLLVTTLTSPSATYSDTTADGSLGAAVPTTNTTGVVLTLGVDPKASMDAVSKQYADTKLPASTYTAADVLAKLRTVDGDYFAARIQLPSNADWNNYSSNGLYLFGDTSGHTNSPGFSWGLVEVFYWTGTYTVQRATSLSSVSVKYRTKDVGNIWSAWSTVWTSANDGAGSGLDADLWHGLQLSAVSLIDTAAGGSMRPAYLAATDLNAFKTTGFYHVNPGAIANNAPVSSNGILKVFAITDPAYVLQEYTTWDGRTFVRALNIGVWSTWETIWNSGNNGPGRVIDFFIANTEFYAATNGSDTTIYNVTGITGTFDMADLSILIDPELVAGRTVYFEAVAKTNGTSSGGVNLYDGANLISGSAVVFLSGGAYQRTRTAALPIANISGKTLTCKFYSPSGPGNTIWMRRARLVII